MAKKQTDQQPENNPQAGGSYTRHPDTGELKQTEGLGMQTDASEPSPQPSAPSPQSPTNNQE